MFTQGKGTIEGDSAPHGTLPFADKKGIRYKYETKTKGPSNPPIMLSGNDVRLTRMSNAVCMGPRIQKMSDTEVAGEVPAAHKTGIGRCWARERARRNGDRWCEGKGKMES